MTRRWLWPLAALLMALGLWWATEPRRDGPLTGESTSKNEVGSPGSAVDPARPPGAAKSLATNKEALPNSNSNSDSNSDSNSKAPGSTGPTLSAPGQAGQAALGAAGAAAPPRYAVSKTGIQAAVQDARPALVECYESWLQTNPGLGGKVVVNFEITPSAADPSLGVVSSAQLKEASTQHPLFESCILAAMSDLSFEAPNGALKVTYPLNFSSPDAGAWDGGV